MMAEARAAWPKPWGEMNQTTTPSDPGDSLRTPSFSTPMDHQVYATAEPSGIRPDRDTHDRMSL